MTCMPGLKNNIKFIATIVEFTILREYTTVEGTMQELSKEITDLKE